MCSDEGRNIERDGEWGGKEGKNVYGVGEKEDRIMEGWIGGQIEKVRGTEGRGEGGKEGRKDEGVEGGEGREAWDDRQLRINGWKLKTF
ncbi:hypothetical protein E2C01_069792 [Portunus trituberculatus]|uniref:Uncharacterized protein n=1 Tax=Portunus trituberculatus TaxID=210409 RepID=A0A5B7HZW1_PORTR|nr:hypothetical protein [Portunus trituberculatus]